MALSIQISDADFSQVIASLSLPDRSGLVAEYAFGGNAAKSVVNRAAPGLASMTEISTPLYGSNYAEISAVGSTGNGFETGVVCPQDATIITVVKKVSQFPGFFHAKGTTGFHNYTSVPAVYNSLTGALSFAADLPVPASTDFVFYAGTLPAGNKAKLYIYEGGILSTNLAEVNGGNIRPAGTFVIGGPTYNSSGAGTARVAYTALFNRVLSDGEVAAAYTSLKTYLATRGVTVS